MAEEFQVSFKYRLRSAVYDKERKAQVHWKHLVTMQLPVIEGEMRFQGTQSYSFIAQKNSYPGDIYVPSWKPVQSAALDILMTSSLQPNTIFHAAEKYGFAIEAAKD